MSRPVRALSGSMLACLLACSANPQRLPVAISQCVARSADGSAHLEAVIENRSDRPISEVMMSSMFYQNFRYVRFNAQARFARELDPGDRRQAVFEPDPGLASASVRGQAMRCYVTHIRYLDGTSADAPLEQ